MVVAGQGARKKSRRERQMTYNGPMPVDELPLPIQDRDELVDFCSVDADRRELLISSLTRRGLVYEVLPLRDAEHIVVPAPRSASMDKEYFRVTLVAHYDCVPGTPGANDNAAAVFQILAHLEEIRKWGWRHRTQVIFTDKEEILGDASATSQGAWILARELKSRDVNNILFFVLDMCGIGDVPVWGRSLRKAGIPVEGTEHEAVHGVMEAFLKRFTQGEDFGVNPLFSDDLGLLLGGYPAIQVSLLPRHEALTLADRFGSTGLPVTDPDAPAKARDRLRKELPVSWKTNHGPADDPDSLEAGAFRLMARLLRELARFRFPLT